MLKFFLGILCLVAFASAKTGCKFTQHEERCLSVICKPDYITHKDKVFSCLKNANEKGFGQCVRKVYGMYNSNEKHNQTCPKKLQKYIQRFCDECFVTKGVASCLNKFTESQKCILNVNEENSETSERNRSSIKTITKKQESTFTVYKNDLVY
ncbi:uncharacterized protein [Centruroides vittatus]|uniref:uncharacterized protein n=1 Tax=Centruroides vittatus TaxID=120091 RepID=UPI00350FAADB